MDKKLGLGLISLQVGGWVQLENTETIWSNHPPGSLQAYKHTGQYFYSNNTSSGLKQHRRYSWNRHSYTTHSGGGIYINILNHLAETHGVQNNIVHSFKRNWVFAIKLKFPLIVFIFATWWCKPLIFQT